MGPEAEWQRIRGEAPRLKTAGVGILRATLLFSSAFIALALLATPMLDREARSREARVIYPSGVDMIQTGSVRRDEGFVVLRRATEISLPSRCAPASPGPDRCAASPAR